MVKLTAQEVAELKGCGEAAIRKSIRNGKIKAQKILDSRNNQRYIIELDDLPLELQDKYYLQNCASKEIHIKEVRKNLDEYSADERAEITLWLKILDDWMLQRATKKSGKSLEDFDAGYVKELKNKYPDMKFSRQILYRKKNAYKDGDLDGLLDNRGKSKKGYSKINEEVWKTFCSFYFNENKPSIQAAYDYTIAWLNQNNPDLVKNIPDYTTFTRKVKRIPVGTLTLAREGEKAYDDKCAPYIRRTYDDLKPNDIWIADNHTFDVMCQDAEGNLFRLYLTAFLDARSGIFTGYHVTTSPSSYATVIALRKGITQYGIPKEVYLDNGREFLTFDLGGLGHRRKRKDDRFDPAPIFQRLGIKMTNALVRNAKAKIIERRFLDVKNRLSKLFESYTGGTVVEKPEKLKKVLKEGNAALDESFVKQVGDLLEGYFNFQPYNGGVKADKGKRKIDVYNEYMAETAKRVATKDDLNLMLMRSTRAQKVTRRGVHVDISGVRIDYWDYSLLQNMLGEQVFLRYDPDDLTEVRVYNLDDRYIMSVPTDNMTILKYGANAEDVKRAMAETRKGKKLEKERMRSMINAEISNKTALEITLSQAKNNLEETLDKPEYDIKLQTAKETPLLHKVELSNIDRMLKNAEEHKGGHDNV